MSKISELNFEGLNINGNINEKLPSVTDGLVAHFPMDGNVNDIKTEYENKYISTNNRDWLGKIFPQQYNYANCVFFISGYVKGTLTAIDTVTTGIGFFMKLAGDKPLWNYASGCNWQFKNISNWTYFCGKFTVPSNYVSDLQAWIQINIDWNTTGYIAEYKDIHYTMLKNPNIIADNCTLTKNGIYVEEGTTNLIKNSDFNDGLVEWSQSNQDDNDWKTVTEVINTPFGKGVHYHYERRSGSGNAWWVGSNSARWKAEGVVTLSCYVKINRCENNYLQIRNSAGQNDWGQYGGTTITTYNSSHVNKGWQKCVITKSTWGKQEGQDGAMFEFCTGATDTVGSLIDFELANVQVERKPYATSYTKGTRQNSGLGLQIPMPFKQFPFSVSMDVIPDIKNGIDSIYGTEKQHMYIAGLWKTGFGDKNYSGQIHQVFRSSIKNGLENGFRYTVIYKNATQWDAYFNTNKVVSNCGYWQPNHIFEIPYYTIGARGYESSLGYANALYKNISFYNKELCLQEIQKLCNNKFSITKEGNINSVELIEKPYYIPQDAYYFPLSFDTKDQYGVIQASEKTNLVYEDGSVWVGNKVENLFKCPIDSKFAVNAGKVLTTESLRNGIIYSNVFSSEKWNYSGWDIPIKAGTKYSMSCDVHVSPHFNGNYSPYVAFEQAQWSYFYKKPTNGFQHFENIVACTKDGKCRMLLYPCCNNDSASMGIVKYKNPMFVSLPFLPPFTSDTRDKSSLEYNLNRDIGLDWSKDWSICYWKKPVGTHDDTLNGYNIESLGCNSNNIGKGYIYWGKNNNGNNINSSTPSDTNPSLYFNNWRFISLVKKGITLTIREFSPLEGVYTRTVGITTENPKYYVTQYGYDLKLGGWDKVACSNSYFRDLIVAKRAFTDEETNKLYRTLLVYNNNNLYLGNQFREEM